MKKNEMEYDRYVYDNQMKSEIEKKIFEKKDKYKKYEIRWKQRYS